MNFSHAKPRVLVIDRDSSVQRLIYRMMRDQCEVHASFSVTLGLNFMIERPYDLIVAATDLPEPYRGSKLVEALRAQPGYADIPVISLLAAEEKADTEVLGSTTCLHKPLSIQAITTSILDTLQLKPTHVNTTMRTAA